MFPFLSQKNKRNVANIDAHCNNNICNIRRTSTTVLRLGFSLHTIRSFQFCPQVKKIAREEFEYSAYEDETVNPYVAGFFEGLLVYAAALNTTLQQNGSITDGRHIISNMWNRTFGGEYRLLAAGLEMGGWGREQE